MKIKKSSLVQLIILVVIVIVFGVAAFKLIRWNSNHTKELKSVDTDENFDLETEDYVAFVSPLHLEGRTDDGITSIVMLGNDVLNAYPGEDGIAKQIAAQTKGPVYDCSIAGSYIACDSSSLLGNDAFSLFAVMNAIASGDFSHMKSILESLDASNEDYNKISASIKSLEAIDFNTIDALTILYGPQDYLQGKVITNPENMNDITTYTGSLLSAIETLQAAYPHIRIITASPSYCLVAEENGSFSGCDVTDTGYGMMPDYMVAAKNIAVMTNTSFLDNYFGLPIKEENASKYIENEIYPNKDTRTLLAGRIAEMILKVPNTVKD